MAGEGAEKQQELWAGAGEHYCGGHLEVSLSSDSPGWGPGVALCDAGPKGGSAYLVDGSRRQDPVPRGSEPPTGGAQCCATQPRKYLPAKRGQGRQQGAGSLCQNLDLSLRFGSVQTHVSKLSVYDCMRSTFKCVAMSLLVSVCLCVCVSLCARVCHMWGSMFMCVPIGMNQCVRTCDLCVEFMSM